MAGSEEAATGNALPQEKKSRLTGLFWKKEKAQDTEKNENETNEAAAEAKDQKKEAELPPVSLIKLFRFATPLEITLNIIGLVAAAGAGAAQPLMTLIFGNLTKTFVQFGAATANAKTNPTPENLQALADSIDHFKSVAAHDALILALIGVGMGLASWYYMYVWGYTAEVNAKRIRERYLQAVLRQDIAFFDTVGAGEIATRIQTDTHLVQTGMSEKVALCVQYTSSFFTGFILAYVRSWRLALAMSSIFPGIALIGSLMAVFSTKYTKISLDSVAEGGTLAEEVISTIRTAHAFGSQKILAKLYDTRISKARTADIKGAIAIGLVAGGVYFIIYGAYGLAFHFGTTLILQGRADVGIVVNVFMAILIGSFSLVMIMGEAEAMTHGTAAAAKLFATIDRVPPIDSLSHWDGLKPDGAVKGDISFREVSFSYPSRPDVPVLRGLSIDIKAGQTAALVGASGSGKSTVIGLIERFYDPLSGSVHLDGQDLKDLNVNWLRSQIGLVSQEPILFATTIRGNVTHGLIGSKFEHESEETKEKLIREACITANADGFISKLPEGYDTLVGERGFLLSGGQKQRIAIARAIVSDPRILLLDEATSALDTLSEGIVQNALDNAAAGRTTIVIAHRLSTIKDADQIYVMGDGMFLEQGTHDELLANPDGPYARLVAAQRLRDTFHAGELPGPQDYELDSDAPREITLGRKETDHSVPSAIVAQKEASAEVEVDKEYSLYYLFRRMATINKDSWGLYIWGAIGAFGSGCIYPGFAIVYAEAVTAFTTLPNTEENRRQLRRAGNRNALWFFIIAIGACLTLSVQNYCFTKSAAVLCGKLRSLGFRAILRQDIEYFDREKSSTGILTARLSENPKKISGLAGVTLGVIVQAVSKVLIGSIVGLAYGPKLAAVGIACIPFVISAGYVRLRIVEMKDETNKDYHEESAQMACEAASSIRTVASLTMEKDCCDIYSRYLETPLKRAKRVSILSTFVYALTQAMTFFVIALVFWYGSRLVANGTYDTKIFFVCLMAIIFCAIEAGEVFSYVPDVSAAKGAATKLINLFDTRPSIDADSSDGAAPSSLKGGVILQDIHFRYPTRPEVRVLQGLDISAEPGTYVALVGASGCGKSTVVQLLERFYDPLGGSILLDGQVIDELNVSEYRKRIALVSQEPTLYGGTIRFNVLLGAAKPQEEVTQEEIEAACRDANIMDFINSLPDGFETQVGSKGTQLSGGQKQRIAIARALLRNPTVLLLDEATSALDSESEKVVQVALDQAARGRTTIAIAHRLSTIQNADRIYFIQDGRVYESGTHDQLTRKRGAYYEYTRLQQLSRAD